MSTDMNILTGQIILLQQDSFPGAIRHNETNTPYFSEKIWNIGDTVSFDIREIKTEEKNYTIAVNLKLTETSSRDLDKKQEQLKILRGFEAPDKIGHKNGHVTNPRPNYSAPIGYSLLWISGVVHATYGSISINPGQDIWYHYTSNGIPIGTPNGSAFAPEIYAISMIEPPPHSH